MKKRIEVCTWDSQTGLCVVDHQWDTTDDTKELQQTYHEAMTWAEHAIQYDRDSDHVIYVRIT